MEKNAMRLTKMLSGGAKRQSKPEVLAEISEKDEPNRRSRKMNRPYEKLKIHFPR
jgi:hypothetical protein